MLEHLYWRFQMMSIHFVLADIRPISNVNIGSQHSYQQVADQVEHGKVREERVLKWLWQWTSENCNSEGDLHKQRHPSRATNISRSRTADTQPFLSFRQVHKSNSRCVKDGQNDSNAKVLSKESAGVCTRRSKIKEGTQRNYSWRLGGEQRKKKGH